LETILLIILIVGAWFWLDSVSKREIAVNFGHDLAKRFQLQLLDETVACSKLRLERDDNGHAQIMRLYEFEVTVVGNERMQCHLALLGKQLKSWHIPPYLQPLH
jgi:hypothetical protein